MNTIFITVGEPIVARNIMRTSFFPTLKQCLPSDARIVLIVESKQARTYADLADGERVVLEPMPLLRPSLLDRTLAFVARNAFYTGTNDVMQRRAYALRESHVPPIFKRTLGRLLGGRGFFQSLVRRVELWVTPHQFTEELFERYRPSLVFSTIILNTHVDVPIVREAKRRDVRVIGMVRSWDNLTSFGFLRLLPDTFIAQSDYIKAMTGRLHFMPVDRSIVVGLPHYDSYKDQSLIMPREAFLKPYGLDPRKRIILYAAVGEFLFRKEAEMAEVFEGLIEQGELGEAAVIYRTHPSFPMSVETMRSLRHVVPDDASTKSAGYDAFAHLVNLLAHADVVVTAGSTMMIDAIAMGKPAVTVTFDGRSGDSYWFSVARFHDRFTHIVELLKEKGVAVASSKEEMTQAVNRYFADPSNDIAGRSRVIERFVAPFDGKAGERLAKAVAHAVSH